jgi:hypothetical protein
MGGNRLAEAWKLALTGIQIVPIRPCCLKVQRPAFLAPGEARLAAQTKKEMA